MRKKLSQPLTFALGILLMAGILGGTLAQPVSWAQENATSTTTPAPSQTPSASPMPSVPTAEVNRIWGYRVDNVFPTALRFFVGLNAARDEVTALSLTVHQTSGLNATFTLDLDETWLEDESTEASTQFLFEWMLDDPPVPVPFEPLEYTWQATTDDGMVSIIAASILFQDNQHEEWHSAGSAPLTLHWLNPSLAGVMLRKDVLRTYRLVETHIDTPPNFIFVIYDPLTTFCQQKRDEETDEMVSVVISHDDGKIFPCSRDAFVQLYTMAGVIFIERPTFGYTALQDLLIREVVGRSYAAYWGQTTVPDWFTAGLAQLYQQHPHLDMLELARSAARTDALYTWERLAQAFQPDALYTERRLWDAESYLLVLYLADRYGAEAPITLAQSIPQHEDFDAALHALTGTDAATLWAQWQRWLFSAAAERAAAWTPYLETTPTPSATPTETPIPPTRTPSNTPPPSATPTFAANFVPTAIIMQRSPTAHPTLTNTPRPPGSLPTVTPRPTVAPAPAERTSVTLAPLGLLTALAVGATLALLLLWWVLRRLTRQR